jgi:hypothetical protein
MLHWTTEHGCASTSSAGRGRPWRWRADQANRPLSTIVVAFKLSGEAWAIRIDGEDLSRGIAKDESHHSEV